MGALEKYLDKLANVPAPGGANGCHQALLGIANLGVLAGLEPGVIFDDIRRSIPSGQRSVPDKEISDAVNKAIRDQDNGREFTPPEKPAIPDGYEMRDKLITLGAMRDEVDFAIRSPVPLAEETEEEPIVFLKAMYFDDDLIWIGDRHETGVIGRTIRTSRDWIWYFQHGGIPAPFIVINPVNGIPAPTKGSSKNPTLRGDNNVTTFRYCMAEFDDLSREDQIRFWSAIKVPVMALVDSGGKSIHAWIDIRGEGVDCLATWDAKIKRGLYDTAFIPMGVDRACSNPARLSRFPGHFREGNGRYQRTLFLKSFKEGSA